MTLLTRRERNRYPATRDEDPGILSLRDEMNRLFEDFLPGFGRSFRPGPHPIAGRDFIPAIDMSETNGEIKVSAELPGLTENDVTVELDEDMLTISGEKKQEKEDEKGGRYWRESSYGSFRRDVPLPADVDSDKAKASFKNGRLRVTMPKNEEAKAKRKPLQINPE